jgi:hypothetical protein
MAKRALLLAMLAASMAMSLAGCSLFRSDVVIDWVNFVRFGGITYLASFDAGRELQPADLGAQFATVRFRLDGNVSDPNYQSQDGDAAFLDAGTAIYRVNGYVPTFRLAAYQGGHIVLFEADTNPHAKTGADLLDIGGRVQSITVTDDISGGALVATLADAHLVTTLVSLLLSAPVDQSRQSGDTGARYFLAFHLGDGTQVSRLYLPDAHEVARGIILPDAFVSALAAALAR